MSILKRAARVSFVSGMTTILTIIFSLITVPICLKYWGIEKYGNWIVLYSIFLLISSIDSGYVNFIGNKLNLLYYNNKEKLHKHLSSALVGILIISSIQILICLMVLYDENTGKIFGYSKGEIQDNNDKYSLMALILSWVLTGSYIGILHRLLLPAGLILQGAWFAMIYKICQFIAIIFSAYYNLSLIDTSILFVISQSLIYLGSAYYIKIKMPEFYPWWNEFKFRIGIKDFISSILIITSMIVQQTAANGFNIIVNQLSGAITVPIYTTIRTISNLWGMLTNILIQPLLPDITRLISNEEFTKLNNANNAYQLIISSAINFGIILTYPITGFAYRVWTRNSLNLDSNLLSLLLASTIVLNSGSLMYLIINAMNNTRYMVTISLARAGFSLGLSYFLYGHMGIKAFGIAILASEIIVLCITNITFNNYLIDGSEEIKNLTYFNNENFSILMLCIYFINEAFLFIDSKYSYSCIFIFLVLNFIYAWKKLDQSIKLRLISLLRSV